MNDIIRKIKQEENLKTNNWRKMHGLPMLRGEIKKLKRRPFQLQPIQNPTLCVKIDDDADLELIREQIKKFYENKTAKISID